MILSKDGKNLEREIQIHLIDTEDCLTELIRFAREIGASHPAPFYLFASGGIDSQAMIFAWSKSGIPFTVVHVDYHGLNAHDRGNIVEFCESLNVPLEIKSFDLLHFLENDLDRYARTYLCASPQICTHIAFSELVEGTKIFAGNFATGHLQGIDNTIFGLQRYATISSKSLIPFFLMQDYRVSSAAIKANILLEDSHDHYKSKCELYRSLGIPIIPQDDKQTGFEIVKEYYDQFSNRVSSDMKLRHSALPSKRVFDQLFRNKYLIEFNNHYKPAVKLVKGPL